MNFFSYVIYNQEYHRFYYGFTDNLKNAEIAHNQGKVDLTKDVSPWVMVYHEGFDTKVKAIRRCKFYMSQNGQRFIKRELNL
ncbi:GIY-YIG nuclease family protein [Sunxiuqinia sp. A32]|uniref:GIY-YIG nuclease family protein n=1 Tax=Sunxiuqinia sp. A32 TaxID=3461496 RepID=UPI004045BA2F